MIKVHRLNGDEVVVNAHLIETIESRPDTVLTLTTGRQFVILDSVDDIILRAQEYRARIGALSAAGKYSEIKDMVDPDDPGPKAYGREGSE